MTGAPEATPPTSRWSQSLPNQVNDFNDGTVVKFREENAVSQSLPNQVNDFNSSVGWGLEMRFVVAIPSKPGQRLQYDGVCDADDRCPGESQSLPNQVNDFNFERSIDPADAMSVSQSLPNQVNDFNGHHRCPAGAGIGVSQSLPNQVNDFNG